MSYTSNPIMKDTDFDGVWDGYGKDDEENKNKYRDENPKDNTIGGKITMLNSKELEVINSKRIKCYIDSRNSKQKEYDSE